MFKKYVFIRQSDTYLNSKMFSLESKLKVLWLIYILLFEYAPTFLEKVLLVMFCILSNQLFNLLRLLKCGLELRQKYILDRS